MSDDRLPVKPQTYAAQAGGRIDDATGAIIPPIHLERSEEHTSELQSPCNLV